VVLVAKNSDMAGLLGKQFEGKKVHKEYEAIVIGVPERKEGLIDMSLGFEVKRSFRMRTSDPLGQSCQTTYRVIEVRGGYSHLLLTPQTGRTHQLRAHMAFSGHPIVGDKVYIDLDIFDRYVKEGWQEDMLSTVKLSRLGLHATKICFFHPILNKEIEVVSSLPRILKDFFSDTPL
jgi:23S rRNA-/tRNA-specific pseudouridylate synthase